jgi:3-oxoacyl-[acyl-carrier-protein] synthase-3
MIINYLSDYLPSVIISNDYFLKRTGLTNEEIILKSGIKRRRHTQPGENTNSMAIEAVKKIGHDLPFLIQEIDLIIGATYTPFDTVGTLAHAVQKQFNIPDARCFTVDSACSSFINAMEIADCYFTYRKANKALIIVSENNSVYYDPSDPKSSFLWGDGAAAIVVTNRRYSEYDLAVLDLDTKGLGHIGKSTEAVCLKPRCGGLRMPYGRDVFQYACEYMVNETRQILNKNSVPVSSLNYFIAHQANARIIKYIAKKLELNSSSVLTNIDELGNTGSASIPIILSQNRKKFKANDTIAVSAFGGGYSCGTMLLKKL